MKKLHLCMAAIASIWCCIQSSQVLALDSKTLAPVSVSDAVVYVPLGNSKTTIAFFTIKNNNNEAVSITKISSTAVKKIDLVPAIPKKENTPNPWLIPVGQVLVLKPERQYLQLTGLKNSLSTGDELQLEVSLSNGKKLVVIARAKSAFDQIHGH